MAPFAVSVVIPVMDEADSLRITVEAIMAARAEDLHEVIVVIGPATTIGVRETLGTLQTRYPDRISVETQTEPRLGGALRTGIDAASGTHVLTMFSDLESDPATVPHLVAAARRSPGAIISASRWRDGGSFEQYGGVKLALNRAFQRTFAWLFRADVTDFTFGYRLYPGAVVKTMAFTETGHCFVLESLLRALMCGVTVIEVPTRWRRRQEGRSHITIFTYLSYWWVGLRLRAGWAREPPP